MSAPERHALEIRRPPGAEPVMTIDGRLCRVVTIQVRDDVIRVTYEQEPAP